MKKLLFLFVLLATALQAQVSPPPATPAEVIAGTDRHKYITPYSAAQAGLSSPTGGVSQAQVVTIVQDTLGSGTNDAEFGTLSSTNFVGNGVGLTNLTDDGLLRRATTNQWSRGSGRYYGPAITDGGNPLVQNNGWGSIDLQAAVFPEVSGSYSGTANTNSAGGIGCFIGGGYGNLIYQSQACYDLNGFVTIGSAINSGTFNTIQDASQCYIGGGDGNSIVPVSAGEFSDDSVILFGINSRITSGIDVGIGVGWNCTNGSSGGSIINGWKNWMEQSGWAILSGSENKMPGANAGSFIVSGENNMLTNSPYSWSVSSHSSIVQNAAYSGVVGSYLTNTEPWSIKVGSHQTNAITVRSNGQLVVQGPLFVGSGTSTNRSKSTIVSANPFPDIDTPYTNRNQAAEVQFTVGAYNIIGSGDIALAYLLVDQDANGTYEENDNFVGLPDQATVLSMTFQISRRLEPNARFMLAQTNASFGGVQIFGSRISYY